MSFVVEQQPLPTSPLGRELINDPSALESNAPGHLTARPFFRPNSLAGPSITWKSLAGGMGIYRQQSAAKAVA